VSDDGVGFEPASATPDGRTRFGLAHLAERIAIAGGSLDIHSSADHGCLITVHLPLTAGTGREARAHLEFADGDRIADVLIS
jgi:signal transduction histidine kinase